MKVHMTLAALLLAGPLTAQQAGDLTLAPFTFQAYDGTTIEAEKGRLLVPERHSSPAGPLLELAVLRLPSTATVPGPPILFLAGGPGGAGIFTLTGDAVHLAQVLREFGDVFAVDQRGTGESVPDLDCRAKDALRIPADAPFDTAGALAQLDRKSRRCARSWHRRGVDLDAFNTVESADDLELLRRALGVEHLILWGESYGTHLALSALRRHGEHVQSVLLFGVEGPDHTAKLPRNVDRNLRALAAQIRRDPFYGPLLPDPVGTLEALITRLNATPQTLDTVTLEGGRPLTLTFGGEDVRLLFAQSIADDEFFSLAPALLVTAEAGDYSVLAQVLTLLREPLSLSAMTFAVDCASGASAKRLRKIARQANRSLLGRLTDFPFPEACGAWGVNDLGDEYRSPVRSPVPALLVSGTLDGRTPVSNAREVARTLPNAQRLVIEGAGHDGVLRPDPRVWDLIRDFLADRPLATDRVSILPLEFEGSEGG